MFSIAVIPFLFFDIQKYGFSTVGHGFPHLRNLENDC
jgi:hypothetical protein